MKWKNPGHEFDAVYQNIKRKRAYYFFGAGADGKLAAKICKTLFFNTVRIEGFIDNDRGKQGRAYCNLPVIPMDAACDDSDDIGIIISVSLANSKPLEDELKGRQLRENVDYFHYCMFLSVLAAYEHGKLFFSSVSFLPSTRCNLQCKACLNFTPYIKTNVDRDIERLKESIDCFFRVVDYIGIFHVSGGEPLLYPELPELLRYLAERYGKQIFSLQFVTNGTVLPKPDLLEVFASHEITVMIDDYRDTVEQAKKTFDEVFERFRAAGDFERIIVNRYREWIDLQPFQPPKMDWNAERMSAYFDACRVPWQEYRDGKLYLCNYADFAAVAGIVSELAKDEYYDFAAYTPNKMKELMEFRMGYSKKGYTEFCRRCSGFSDINPNHVPPAEQAGRGNENGQSISDHYDASRVRG